MSTQHVSGNGASNGSNGHLSEPPRYARDPTRGVQALHYAIAMTPPHSNGGSSGSGGGGGNGGRNQVPSRTLPSSITMAQGSSSDFVSGEFSPWDEDKLWRDKLRRASIRHTRSMDMLDEIHQDGHSTANNGHPSSNHHNNNNNDNHNNNTGRQRSSSSTKPVAAAAEAEEKEEDCYERLLQYSATLERTKRGQTYLDGYLWDEMEQRFRKPGRTKPVDQDNAPPPLHVPTANAAAAAAVAAAAASSSSSSIMATTTSSPPHPFLEDGLPPPAFEIDREKLRQWDLMSTAPVPASDNRNSSKEGGRRLAALDGSTNTNTSTSNNHTNNTTTTTANTIDNNSNNNSNNDHRHPSVTDQINRAKPSLTLVPSSPPPPLSPPQQPTTQGMRPSPNQLVPPDLVRTPGKMICLDCFCFRSFHLSLCTFLSSVQLVSGLFIFFYLILSLLFDCGTRIVIRE